MHFPFTKYSNYYYIFSGVLIAVAVVSLAVFGLQFGIEFTGGSTMELEFLGDRPPNEQISQTLSAFNLGEIVIQPTGQKSVIIRLKEIDEATHANVLAKISELSEFEELNFQYIGPSVGNEIKRKTVISIIVVLAAITLYIAFAFKKVSRPVSSFKYGTASLIALFHDILIPLGLFSLLGKLYNVEITIPIIAALLTVLGFSVHDTIVIFDRIRENLLRQPGQAFEQTVNASLNQTLGRSLSTVATTLFVMIAIFFFGGATLKYFALALIVGISSGAYSSIFIAGPVLVSWFTWSQKRVK